MSHSPDQEQDLIGHLQELRKRLIYSIFAVAIAAVICWNFSEEIMGFIRQPIAPYLPQGGLVFTGIMDKFMAHIKVSVMSGIIVSCPFWIYQIWRFVAPGLYESERKYAGLFIVSGSLLFMIGVCFVYFFVYPTAFEYLMGFGGTEDKPMITIGEYLSFFVTTILLFGFAFELPLIMVVMALIGLIDVQFLKKHRRYAVVVLAIVAAVLTPTPDVLSMAMMLGPLILLYEMGIWTILFLGRNRTKG